MLGILPHSQENRRKVQRCEHRVHGSTVDLESDARTQVRMRTVCVCVVLFSPLCLFIFSPVIYLALVFVLVVFPPLTLTSYNLSLH